MDRIPSRILKVNVDFTSFTEGNKLILKAKNEATMLRLVPKQPQTDALAHHGAVMSLIDCHWYIPSHFTASNTAPLRVHGCLPSRSGFFDFCLSPFHAVFLAQTHALSVRYSVKMTFLEGTEISGHQPHTERAL